ncbi:hypothetical protein SEA_YEET_170 [Mycobacterium phage Yeet]|uniref:Uncharacterized protein n=4 Tax=Omegavirus TaxID=1623292 RepID=A0A3S9UB64_9CAUD|nr:hypothetical protein [Acinetobacter baumannii]YP_008410330.1 hypothetical protein N860_gp172 [Mycobacterium phage Redno2]YP_008410565.1 hypothetical protein N857_gp176 [Mycobacterium phage Wanda]YP_009018173.1 hypothetical protein CL87_gp162 [Mycobacterium phage Thibault]YP_009124131.1 hypothetical protein VC71_gp178 [Mycobacterium phage Minerva]YP_009591033.1 hypothetical protein FDG54_gp177 [Mycobacterium phage Optimus]YP_009636355.1 hypothetical protein FGG20_gp184 [Mycobacterium phage 
MIRRPNGDMVGPRDSVIRELLTGEEVPVEDWVMDQSEFVDTNVWRYCKWYDLPPEFWVDKIYDHVGECE